MSIIEDTHRHEILVGGAIKYIQILCTRIESGVVNYIPGIVSGSKALSALGKIITVLLLAFPTIEYLGEAIWIQRIMTHAVVGMYMLWQCPAPPSRVGSRRSLYGSFTEWRQQPQLSQASALRARARSSCLQ